MTAVPPPPAAPDATAGDELREAIAAWLFRKVIHRDGLVKLQWEHLMEPQITGWLEGADELLALPALRDVLAAAARDAEKVRRVEALWQRLESGYWRDANLYAKSIRRALDGTS